MAAVFTLALTLGVNSHVIPIAEVAGHGLSYTAVSRPSVVVPVIAHPHAAIDVHAAAHAWGIHAPWSAVHAAHWPVVAAHSAAIAHHVVVPDVHAAPVVVAAPAHEGSYVAKTRGAVHTAPLAGHAASVASVNVAPAPGTV